MRWRGRRQSSNIEDRRGRGLVRSKKGIGAGGMIILILAGLFFGKDVQNILSVFVGAGTQNQVQTQVQTRVQTSPARSAQHNDELKQFVATVLAETEDTWANIFAAAGQRYQAPVLVLYDDQVQSACGLSSSASGPFYCPGDFKIYIDLSFMSELRRMGAEGDFAFAYVIAHEVGHHVQNLIGIAKRVRQQQAQASQVQSNAIQVGMELQADCFAGIWINHTERRNTILEAGDIQEGMEAAAAVGDDRIMRSAGRAPRRENFTHGSSQERMQAFDRGMRSGDLNVCIGS